MESGQLPEDPKTGAAEEEDFETLLNRNFSTPERFEPGEKVEAVVVEVTDEWVFIDFGGKSEGYIAVSEVLDEEGTPGVKEGERLEAFFLSAANSEYLFTTRIGRGMSGRVHVQAAYENGIPVEGRVESETKGGYRVQIAGKIRGFCPYSQSGATLDPETVIEAGSTFSFKIIEMDPEGRDIVLSRKAVLEEELRQQVAAFRETLEEGMVVRGIISSIRDFGAFVKVGPIEGLIPVSEIARGRVERVGDVLGVGEEVDVKAVKLDWEAERYSFSIKETIPDPWETIQETYPEGSIHTGTVVRLERYGAFVNLEPGVDGLLHISRLGKGRRINHPREVVNIGMEVEVRIDSVDTDRGRLGLTLASAGEEEPGSGEKGREEFLEYRGKADESAKGALGTLGDLFSGALNDSKKRR
jgi:small subunit ribosomal protein S1